MSTFDEQEPRPDGQPAEPPRDSAQPVQQPMPVAPPVGGPQSAAPGAQAPAWQQPMQPAAPVATMTKKPGIVGIVLGIILIVLGPILGVILVAVGLVSSAVDAATAPLFGTDEIKTVTLEANTEYMIWVDSTTASTARGGCEVQSPNGESVSLREPTLSTQTLSRGTDGQFEAQIAFTTGAAGDYAVFCQTDSDLGSRFFVSTPLVTKSLGIWVLVGVGVGGLLFVGGVVWLIMAIVRRNRWNKENRVFPAAPGYYPPQ